MGMKGLSIQIRRLTIEIIPALTSQIHSGFPNSIVAMPDSPDPRYLAGIELFNRGEYFEAHEVWEELWQDCPAADRRFYQALIQASVAIYHFDRGNYAGAARLGRSGKRYMEPYRPRYRGLEVDGFWRQVDEYIAPALSEAKTASSAPRPEIILEAVLGDLP